MSTRFTEPEGQRLEYKQEWSDTAKKTLIAFANDLGGLIEVGVADDGSIIGCDFDEVERRVMTFARDGAEPDMTELIRVVPQVIDGKTVAAVIVAPGTMRPYSFRGRMLANGGVYIRLGGQTVAANLDEVIKIIQRGDPREWESRPCGREDLTFEAAKRIFLERNVLFAESTWLGYGLVSAQRSFTNLAFLLSDQCRHSLVVSTYGRNGRIASVERITGSLIRQMEAADAILREVNIAAIDKHSGKQERLEHFPWPVTALREALTKMVAHRDYSVPIQASVNISPDRIVFITPGGIPPEITLEDAMVEGVSYCRNEKLAELFMRLGWMEKAGTGFSDIFRAYTVYKQKPLLRHVVRTFLIELPRTDCPQDPRERELLDFVRNSPLGRSRPEIEDFLGVSRPTVMKVLGQALESGQLIRTGKARAVRYLTPAALSALASAGEAKPQESGSDADDVPGTSSGSRF